MAVCCDYCGKERNCWRFDAVWRESIFDIFEKYKVVFAYTQKAKEKIKLGDLIAIADKHSIIAIGKATTDGKTIADLHLREPDISSGRFNYDNNVTGCGAEIISLKEEDRFLYPAIDKFCQLDDETAQKIQNLLYAK